MSSHSWEDGFPYFRDVGMAADWIGKQLVRWGRICVSQTKEKYGTARVYCHFGCTSFYSLIHPNHFYIRWPRWIIRIDYFIWIYTGIGWIISRILYRLQPFVYIYIYWVACKKWYWIRDEILEGADQSELLAMGGLMLISGCEGKKDCPKMDCRHRYVENPVWIMCGSAENCTRYLKGEIDVEN